MKRYKLRLFVYFLVFSLCISIIVFSCHRYWGLIKDNRDKASKLEYAYKELLDDEENLEIEVVKLQDPEYVAKYAREKYLYSKQGELIIDMTALEE